MHASAHWKQASASAALALSLVLCALAGTYGTHVSGSVLPAGGTQGDRLAYVASLGWQVAQEDETVEAVALPERFDGACAEYQQLQRSCGFDLTPYAGKTVTRYSYRVTNYPAAVGEVRLDLLVLENQIIGGDVRTAALDGFMSSLEYPK